LNRDRWLKLFGLIQAEAFVMPSPASKTILHRVFLDSARPKFQASVAELIRQQGFRSSGMQPQIETPYDWHD
jgi:hypothetical protein